MNETWRAKPVLGRHNSSHRSAVPWDMTGRHDLLREKWRFVFPSVTFLDQSYFFICHIIYMRYNIIFCYLSEDPGAKVCKKCDRQCEMCSKTSGTCTRCPSGLILKDNNCFMPVKICNKGRHSRHHVLNTNSLKFVCILHAVCKIAQGTKV